MFSVGALILSRPESATVSVLVAPVLCRREYTGHATAGLTTFTLIGCSYAFTGHATYYGGIIGGRCSLTFSWVLIGQQMGTCGVFYSFDHLCTILNFVFLYFNGRINVFGARGFYAFLYGRLYLVMSALSRDVLIRQRANSGIGFPIAMGVFC